MAMLAIGSLYTNEAQAQAQAQSCARADSLVGATVSKKALRPTYDEFTDSTTLIGAMHMHTAIFGGGQPANMWLTTQFATQIPTQLSAVSFMVETSQNGEGGFIRGRAAGQQLTRENAKYADLEEVQMIINGETRVRLQRAGYRVRLKKAGAMMPEMLEEKMMFSVPIETLLILAQSKHADVRIGDIRTTIGSDLAKSAREMFRLSVCTGAQ